MRDLVTIWLGLGRDLGRAAAESARRLGREAGGDCDARWLLVFAVACCGLLRLLAHR